MTKEEARGILENWINKRTNNRGDHQDIMLPIIDEVVLSEIINIPTKEELGIWSEGITMIEQWNFKGLIKIAYNLKDNNE